MNFSQLLGLASGHVEARIVQTAVQLAIFDTLQDTVLSSQEIAGRLGLEPKATEWLVNALAAMGLLEKERETFSLTEAARRYLLKSSGEYLGGMIRFDASLWSCWEKLPEAIRSGKPCRRLSNIHATIFDLPGTLRLTERYVREANLLGRIDLIPGDYRSERIPGNYDIIFLSNIIHGESTEKNAALMKKLALNLNPAGLIVVKDHILDESRAHPPVGAIFSLLMLLTTDGGRCYSFAEIRSWLEGAGLKHVRQIDLPAPLTSSLVIGARD